jgi:hypothetical protein
MQPKMHSPSFVHLGGKKRARGNCEMGQGQYDDHKHVTHKSPTQARQCKWLMEMEIILAHKLGLELVHWHGSNLTRGYHHSPYNIFWAIDMAWSYDIHTTWTWEEATPILPIIGYFYKDYIEMIFFPLGF